MNNTEYKPITLGNWIVTFIIMAIPFLNIIMPIIWAFGSSTHPSKKTYAQAMLIFFGILFLIGILASIAIPGAAAVLEAAKEAKANSVQ